MAEKTYKIVLAEDDHILSKYLSSKLKEVPGFEVYTAMDGDEAEQKTHEVVPDLLLLDVIMPKKNGFEVLENLKSDEKTKNVAVIVLSNLGQESDVTKAKELGAADYFVKVDFEVKDIVDKVKQFLGV